VKPPRVLIVAGSDSGGGAGIQADIKTVTMLGGFAMTAVTAITAQNTLGVDAVMPVPGDMVMKQFDAVVGDLGVDAVKIGMIGSAETAEALASRLEGLGVPIVFDPVMVATSGDDLADSATIAAFERLVAAATLVTPNIPELEVLGGQPVETIAEAEQAAGRLATRLGTSVLAKGGHLPGDEITDVLVTGKGKAAYWSDRRIASRATHGTGCTLASAIAVGLGRGQGLLDAIVSARFFVRTAMLAAPGFGKGHGPMGHAAASGGAMNLNQVTLPASNYDESVAYYRTLGLTQIVDSPGRYARFECPGGATLSIHVEAEVRPGDAIVFFESAELDAWVARLEAAGIAFDTPPADESWGWRQARLRDPAGNRLCLYRAGEYRRFPPWRLAGGTE
jgi:hydroxymethylpyrimidine/phosphomethylpyrimidine kinase